MTAGMPAVNTKNTARIGIRAETLHRYERRVPITPTLVHKLTHDNNIEVVVQRSPQRIYPAKEFSAAGATIVTELGQSCPVVFGVKGFPVDFCFPGLATVQFSHVHKGQSRGMPYLKGMMDRSTTLIDYELMANREGRVVAFGVFSGFAGMTDSLHVLGRRLASEGIVSPFADIKRPFEYQSMDAIRDHMRAIGRQIGESGLPEAISPFIVGITGGSGRCSSGAQDVFDHLGARAITLTDLRTPGFVNSLDRRGVYKVIYDRVGDNGRYIRKDRGLCSNKDLLADPQAYESNLGEELGFLTMLIPCHLWSPGQPPLVTPEMLNSIYGKSNTKLRVIGDVTCDIWPEGAIASTVEARDVENAFYVYDPRTGKALPQAGQPSWVGQGYVINACETMPCMLPRDASEAFSGMLAEFVPAIARAEYQHRYESGIITLPEEVRPAVILWNGDITHDMRTRPEGYYQMMRSGLAAHGLDEVDVNW